MAFFKRFLLMSGLWLVLTGSDPGAWVVGLFGAAAAAGLSLKLLPATGSSPRLSAAGGLMLVFLRDSLLGGLDVARRACDPRLPVRPGWIRHPLRLAPGPRRMLFGDIVSLMPGSMGAGDERRTLMVHCLDVQQPVAEHVTGVERRLAAVLGEEPEVRRGHG